MSAVTLHSSNAENGSGTGPTEQIGGENLLVGIFTNITAASGILPTLSLKLQHSPDGTLWVDYPNFTVGYSGTGTNFFVPSADLHAADNVRLVWTVTGVNANFTFECQLEFV